MRAELQNTEGVRQDFFLTTRVRGRVSPQNYNSSADKVSRKSRRARSFPQARGK